MPTDLPIRCSCGTLRGVARGVSPSRGNRVVCYCGDCQSFAHFLGRANEILDARGGSDIFQTSPARVELTQGRERLACMRLTPKGLLRWYADCCQTPIGNTAITPAIPFVGLIQTRLHDESATLARDAALGPVRGHVNARAAKGRAAKGRAAGKNVRESGIVRSIARFVRLLLQARLRGDHKASLFFDARTREPSVNPRVLSEAELREVERLRDAG
ncbi:MAG: DUF6151 family protein [Myxococcota bacterium]